MMSDEMISMPVCEHLTPIKFSCSKCNRFMPSATTEDLTNTHKIELTPCDNQYSKIRQKTDIELLLERIEVLEKWAASSPNSERVESISTSLKFTHQNLSDACRLIEEIQDFNRRQIYWNQQTNQRIDELEARFATIDHLIKSSNTAESLFASKVHELKSIDKKRDDVINALCQKVEMLTKRVMEVSPHPLLGNVEKALDKKFEEMINRL